MLDRLFLTLLGTALACGGASAAPVPSDEAAKLSALAANADAAWNDKRAHDMAAAYDEEGTLRTSPSEPMVRGRQAIEQAMQRHFDRRDGRFRHVTRLDQMEMIAADTVLSEGFVAVEQQKPDGSWSLARRFRTLTIATRRKGEWKLVAVRAVPLG